MDASIVLVDNESKYLVAYERLLRPLRCKILCAQRRSDALSFLSAPRIAIVVVEPCLADGDGLELIRMARTMRPPASGIVVTAFPSPLGARRAGDAGAAGYLAKPFSGRVLVALAERQLATWVAHRLLPTDASSGVR